MTVSIPPPRRPDVDYRRTRAVLADVLFMGFLLLWAGLAFIGLLFTTFGRPPQNEVDSAIAAGVVLGISFICWVVYFALHRDAGVVRWLGVAIGVVAVAAMAVVVVQLNSYVSIAPDSTGAHPSSNPWPMAILGAYGLVVSCSCVCRALGRRR